MDSVTTYLNVHLTPDRLESSTAIIPLENVAYMGFGETQRNLGLILVGIVIFIFGLANLRESTLVAILGCVLGIMLIIVGLKTKARFKISSSSGDFILLSQTDITSDKTKKFLEFCDLVLAAKNKKISIPLS